MFMISTYSLSLLPIIAAQKWKYQKRSGYVLLLGCDSIKIIFELFFFHVERLSERKRREERKGWP